MYQSRKKRSRISSPVSARMMHSSQTMHLNTAALATLLMLPTFAFAQVSVAAPAQSILQIISAGFAVIAGIGVIFCTIAGIFGFAQWTRLLNIMGWIVAGGGGLALATYAASLAVG